MLGTNHPGGHMSEKNERLAIVGAGAVIGVIAALALRRPAPPRRPAVARARPRRSKARTLAVLLARAALPG